MSTKTKTTRKYKQFKIRCKYGLNHRNHELQSRFTAIKQCKNKEDTYKTRFRFRLLNEHQYNFERAKLYECSIMTVNRMIKEIQYEINEMSNTRPIDYKDKIDDADDVINELKKQLNSFENVLKVFKRDYEKIFEK